MLSIQPSWWATRMNTNSATESPTRTLNALSMLRVRPRSRIRKNAAELRLAMIRMNAIRMTHFTVDSGKAAASEAAAEERIVVRGAG